MDAISAAWIRLPQHRFFAGRDPARYKVAHQVQKFLEAHETARDYFIRWRLVVTVVAEDGMAGKTQETKVGGNMAGQNWLSSVRSRAALVIHSSSNIAILYFHSSFYIFFSFLLYIFARKII